MSKIDIVYHNILRKVLNEGHVYEDPNRKGVFRKQIPRYELTYDLNDGFPAITTKKLYWKGVVGELLWFLRGDTDIKYLIDNNIHIWDKDAYNYFLKFFKGTPGEISFDVWKQDVKSSFIPGNCGRIYGVQWRQWARYNGSISTYPDIDQISNLIERLKKNPMSTQHIVTAWNPSELDYMALPPCHKGFQIMCYPIKDTYGFDLVWEQRSVDVFLGLPFNIASYALLAHIIGVLTGYIPGKIYGDLRNVHIYDNAEKAALIQLVRDVSKYDRCVFNVENIRPMKMGMHGKIDSWLNAHVIEDFQLLGYKSYPNIKVEMLSRDERSK